MLERGAERSSIIEALDAARAGLGNVLVVSGPAGVGKTRLLKFASDSAAGSGFRVLQANCTPLEREFSFGLASRLFTSPLAAAMEQERAELLEGASSIAAALTGAVQLPQEDLADPLEQPPPETFPFLNGLYWLVAKLSTPGPLLIVIDDAQWADTSSLRFLSFLAERAGELPLLLAVSTRHGEAADPSADLLADIESRLAARSLRPTPLSPTGIGDLVQRTLPEAPPDLIEACEHATGGVPFLLTELLAELDSLEAESTRAVELVEGIAPAEVGRSVLLRLGRLGSEASEIAIALAVLGDESRLDRVADLAGLPLATAAKVADELMRLSIISEDEDGKLRFVHPLVRSSIYSDIGAVRRGELHRAAGDQLRAEAAGPERVAAHLLKTNPVGDRTTAEGLISAAELALARGSAESAVAYLRRAAQEPPPRELEHRIRLSLGMAELRAGKIEAAITNLAGALHSSQTPAELAKAHLELGRAHMRVGRAADAAASFSAGVKAAPNDRDLTLRNQAEYFGVAVTVPELAASAVGELPAAIAAVGEDELTPASRAMIALAAMMSIYGGAPPESALEGAERALDGGRLLSEEGAGSATLYSITGIFTAVGQYGRSVELLDAAVADARERRLVLSYGTAIYCRSFPQLYRGEVSAAIADARAAVDTASHGWRQYLAVASAVLALALTERGELDAARAALAERDGDEWGSDATWVQAFHARGQLSLLAGDPAAALADFERWGALWAAPNPAFHGDWRSKAALAAAVLGDHERARELVETELGLARAAGIAHPVGAALRVSGLIERGEEGIALLRDAVEILSGTEARLELCRAQVDLGAMMRRDRRRAEAREPLRAGLDLAQQMGARMLEARATEELKLTGARPDGRHLRGADSLSPGELRVARLAISGLTNRQIAQQLFVTQKTVVWHLGNSYRKLAINSRDQLADALSEAAADGEVQAKD